LQNGEWALDDRLYSLDFVDFFAFKVGLKQNYDGLIRPVIEFGVVTNLYTYLDAFTLDAGIPGALMGHWA